MEEERYVGHADGLTGVNHGTSSMESLDNVSNRSFYSLNNINEVWPHWEHISETQFFDMIVDAFSSCINDNCELTSEKFREVLTKFSGLRKSEIRFQLLQETDKSLQNVESSLPNENSDTKKCLLNLKAFLLSLPEQLDEDIHSGQLDISNCNNSTEIYLHRNILYNRSCRNSPMPPSDHEDYEAVGGHNAQKDLSEFLSEMEDLRLQKQHLTEEIISLKSQISSAEDIHQQAMVENKVLQSKIMDLQLVCERLGEVQIKNEEYKTKLSSVETSKKRLSSKFEEVKRQKEKLLHNVKDLEGQLHASQSEVDYNRETLAYFAKSLCEQQSTVQELSQEKIKLQTELQVKTFKCQELEATVEGLTETNESLRHDKKLVEEELLKAKEELSCSGNPLLNISEDPSMTSQSPQLSEIFSSSSMKFPDLISSTPFEHIQPISMELKKAVAQAGNPMDSSHNSSFASNVNMQFSTPIKFQEKIHGPSCKRLSTSPLCCSPDSEDKNRFVTRLTLGFQKYLQHKQGQSEFCDKSEKQTDKRESLLNETLELFLEFIRDSIQQQRKYIEKINIETKATLKEDLDISQLGHQFLPSGDHLDKLHSEMGGDGAATERVWSAGNVSTEESKLVSELSASDIRDQINTEIKALKAQLVRSHALLSYLQMKEKVSSISNTPDPFSSNKKIAKCHLCKSDLLQQRSFDGQCGACLHHNLKRSSNSEEASPIHKFRRVHSCPTLTGDTSSKSKSTQTEITQRNGSTHQGSGDHTQQSPSKFLSMRRYVTVCNQNRERKYSEFSSTSEISYEGSQNIECGFCEVHNVQENAESPQFVRHRTSSFLAAVKSGNPYLRDSSESGVTETDFSQPNSPPLTTSEDYATSQSSKPESIVASDRVVTVKNQNEEKENDSKTTEASRLYATDHRRKSVCIGIADATGDGKKSNDKESTFKSQRSMRRGSGAGSPNSVMSIPRVPAFDYDEQEDDHIETNNRKKGSDKKAEKRKEEIKKADSIESPEETKVHTTSKSNSSKKKESSKSVTLMPEAVEGSETESAKGSFEYETPEAHGGASAETTPSTQVPSVSFPNLPDTVLLKLGIGRTSNAALEAFDEKELESKFLALSLAFKTDKTTLAKRLEIQKRQRDIAEKDIENEIKALKESLNYLNLNAVSSDTRELIAKIQDHVEIVSIAASKISARSETYGAVKQEERVSRAFEVMLLHVENLKRLFDKEHRELEETKKMVSTSKTKRELTIAEGSFEERKRSLKTIGLAVGSFKTPVRRRASVSDFEQRTFNENLRSPSFSYSWSSGFKEARNIRTSSLSPLNTSCSLGLSSSSSLASSSAPIVQSYMLPGSQDRANRRCSLPTTSLSNSYNDSRGSRIGSLEGSPFQSVLGDLKSNTRLSLSSVPDEGGFTEEGSDESDGNTPASPSLTTSRKFSDTWTANEQSNDNEEMHEICVEEHTLVNNSCAIRLRDCILRQMRHPALLHLCHSARNMPFLHCSFSLSLCILVIAVLVVLLAAIIPSGCCTDARGLRQVMEIFFDNIFNPGPYKSVT